MNKEITKAASPVSELKTAIDKQNKKLDEQHTELRIHSVMLDRLCTLKESQIENDTVFRNSWRYAKMTAIFFMLLAFAFDVIEINSVEPALDLIIKMFD